jgi:acetylornithine deacetylase/succinyl-diaminopimelate desuccinylase-like protein
LEADWLAFESETLSRLQTLIRFDTTNPPGNELELAQYLGKTLEDEGIETSLLVPVEGRAAVIARLRGSGAKRPVMLMAHMDVVAVERDKWSCDPFEGVIRDGYLYGRGAIDDKGMLTANLMTMLLLKRLLVDRGVSLSRDVVFLATSDEEAGGEAGIKWVIANHFDLIDVEFALNEGGRTRIIEGGRRYLAIQTAEKIPHLVTITARGPAGHAAIPLEGNAVFRLGRALARLGEYREPVALNVITRRFFGELSRIWPDEDQKRAMADLVSDDESRSARGAEVLARVPVFNAVLRNGISATKLAGGVAGNVIPADASAVLNIRTIPGHSIEAIVDKLIDCVDDPGVEITIASRGDEAPASDPDSEMFHAVASAAKELDPGITVVPYLSTGATDSAQLRRAGIDSCGILPFPMEQPDEERMHGHDERIPVQSLHFGTRLIYESMRKIAAGS